MDILINSRAEGTHRGAVIALGNFDGVHLGHQGVLRFARGHAQRLEAPFAAAVFEPHPRQFFAPQAPPFRLQSSSQRLRALADQQADLAFEIGFDRQLASQSSAEFAQRVLHERFGARLVIVGGDFRFGAGRSGDVAALRALGTELGFEVLTAPVLADAGEKISSSNIRAALVRGQMQQARHWLGRPWSIEGQVQAGAQRGRLLGFPTANVALGEYLRPAFGVYAVLIRIGGGKAWPGVANLGQKPTLGAEIAPLLEAHIFDFSGDIYDAPIEVQLLAHLREERRFDSLDALKAQIARDAQMARALLAAPGLEKSAQ